MSNELILLQRPPAALGKPTKKDRDLFLMKRRGWTEEQLAVRFGMKESAVKEGLDRYQLYRDSFANDEIDLDLNRMASELMPQAQKVLAGGMKAEHTITVGRGKKVIMRKVADHATRLRTVEVMKQMMETARPKGGGMVLNQQFNNGQGEQPAERPKGFDFESRLRDIRAKKGLDAEENIADGEFEDEEKDVLADELAEMGIELDDEDDEDEDE